MCACCRYPVLSRYCSPQTLAKGAQDRIFRFVISLDLFLAVHAAACAISLSAIIA